jgi:hypothetical protein
VDTLQKLDEVYADVQMYRRALIFAVKQMTDEQHDILLKSCQLEIFGAILGTVMVARISSKPDEEDVENNA